MDKNKTKKKKGKKKNRGAAAAEEEEEGSGMPAVMELSSMDPTQFPEMADFMRPMKRQHWQSFFSHPLPALDNATPLEAARTSGGRRKLEELFSLYEIMGGTGGLDLNVPPAWAKWKLGMGPGSAEQFADEEAIFNDAPSNDAPSKPMTKRTPKHETKLRKRQGAVFVPKRCEVEGCDKEGTEVNKCSACTLVFYCSKEHQKQDWPHHKLDCKHLKKSELRRRYFSSAAELENFPIGCFPLVDPPPEAQLKCFICGAGDDEVQLGCVDDRGGGYLRASRGACASALYYFLLYVHLEAFIQRF